MEQTVFWVWNGWGVLFTTLISLYYVLDLCARERGVFIFRSKWPLALLSFAIPTLIFSHWVAALLLFPLAMIVGGGIWAIVHGILKKSQ